MDPSAIPVTVIVVGPTERTDPMVEALADDDRIDGVAMATADTVAARVADGAPDVVVTWAGDEELAAVGRVAVTAPATRFVAVLDGAEPAPAALLDGHIGAVVSSAAEGLGDIITGLARGEAFLDAAMARLVVERIRASEFVPPLSSTEDEVLARLGDGDEVDAIAREYGVAPRLVRLFAGGAVARSFTA